MPVYGFKSTRTQQPQATDQVNRANPISRGITAATIPGYGNRSLIGTLTSGAAPRVLNDGVALGLTASGAAAWGIASPAQVATGEATILWLGDFLGTPTDSACIGGITHNSANTSPYVYVELKRSSAGQIRTEFSTGQLVSSAPTITSGRVAIVVSAKAGAQKLFVKSGNGAATKNTASVAGAISAGTNPRWEVGDSLNARNPNAACLLQVSWDRVLDDVEIASLLDNPWQLFTRQTRIPFAAEVSGGEATGTVAYTNSNDSNSANGSTTALGSLAKTNANDSVTGSGSTTVTGALARSNTSDTSTASGAVGSTVTGTVLTTNASDSSAGIGATTITGALAKTNANDLVTASGSAGTVSGAVAVSNAGDFTAATGSAGEPSIGGGGFLPQRAYQYRYKAEEKLESIAPDVAKVIKAEAAASVDDSRDAQMKTALRDLGIDYKKAYQEIYRELVQEMRQEEEQIAIAIARMI